MRDPYEVLGVKKTADAAAIKSAYRRLAKKLHPDTNKDDPKTAQRFAEINSAYEILGEEKKRKAFDAGEIDAEGKPRFQGFGGPRPGAGAGAGDAHFETFSFGPEGFQGRAGAGGANFEDVISQMFGGLGGAHGRTRSFRGGFEPEDLGEPAGRDVTVPVTITLEEAAAGGTRRVHLPTGKEVDVKISGRAGRRQADPPEGAGPAGTGQHRRCPDHHQDRAPSEFRGRRRQPADPCAHHPLRGGARRQGEVPTLGGAVELAIPAGTSGGRTFRLKGKGLPWMATPATCSRRCVSCSPRRVTPRSMN